MWEDERLPLFFYKDGNKSEYVLIEESNSVIASLKVKYVLEISAW